MWSAKIIETSKHQGQAAVILEYSNGTESFTETLRSTDIDKEWLRQQVVTRIAGIEKAYSFSDSLVVGATVDVTPPTLNKDATDRKTYFTDLSSLNKMQQLIDIGVKQNTDKDFTDLVSKVKLEFKPEFNEI